MLDNEINDDLLTHEVTIPGAKLLIADLADQPEGSFGRYIEDVVGEKTGSNDLAVAEGEKARETHNTRGDIILRYWARRQRKMGAEPLYKLFWQDDGSVIMVTAEFNQQTERTTAKIAHCWATGPGEMDWDFRIIEEREYTI